MAQQKDKRDTRVPEHDPHREERENGSEWGRDEFLRDLKKVTRRQTRRVEHRRRG
jgi:hypothetical protein